MLSRTNRRSSGVTSTSGRSTRVSVVPMHVFACMGITKNSRPSSAKKVRTRRSTVTGSTMTWIPLEKTWRCTVETPSRALTSSA